MRIGYADPPYIGCAHLYADEMVGAEPGDELVDLYPGTGAVTRAWQTWRTQVELPIGDTEQVVRNAVSEAR